MPLPSRSEIVQKTRHQLLKHGYPRLQMFLIVSLTGAIGFISSFLLLDAGMTTLWCRYAIAMGVAYLGFMGMLWVWLHSKSEDYSDFPDFPLPSVNHEPVAAIIEGQGGAFGGGGASGSFEPAAVESTPLASSNSGLSDLSIGDVAEAEELAIPIIVIILVTALLTLSVWIIYSAPVLFSELLVDGVLSITLYKHLRKSESGHWLETAVKHTYKPFLITLLIVVGMGWGLHAYTPDAHTLGEAIKYHKED